MRGPGNVPLRIPTEGGVCFATGGSQRASARLKGQEGKRHARPTPHPQPQDSARLALRVQRPKRILTCISRSELRTHFHRFLTRRAHRGPWAAVGSLDPVWTETNESPPAPPRVSIAGAAQGAAPIADQRMLRMPVPSVTFSVGTAAR